VAALLIRPGRLDEAGVIGALTQRVYRAGGWTDKGNEIELLDARARIEHATLLIAEQGHAVVGTVTIALPGTPFAEISRPDEAEIRMLAVDAGSAGQQPMCGRCEACRVASFALRLPFAGADMERGGQAWFSTRSSLAVWLCCWLLPA
jgi:hypothetical protein